jgi:hypothetical protein
LFPFKIFDGSDGVLMEKSCEYFYEVSVFDGVWRFRGLEGDFVDAFVYGKPFLVSSPS